MSRVANEMDQQHHDFFQEVDKCFKVVSHDNRLAMINNATDETGDIPEQYSCPLCLGLVDNPKTCNICQLHLYCQNCLNGMQGRQKCPMCSQGTFIECNPLVKRNLQNMMVKCNELNCSKKGELMRYTHFMEKHHLECRSMQMECMYCKKILESKEEAIDHFRCECPNIIVGECDLCHEMQTRESMPKHDCASEHLNHQIQLLFEQDDTIDRLKKETEANQLRLLELKKNKTKVQSEISVLLTQVDLLESGQNQMLEALNKVQSKHDQMMQDAEREAGVPQKGRNSDKFPKPKDFSRLQHCSTVDEMKRILKIAHKNAQYLHFKYDVQEGESESREFKDAVYAIQYIMEKKKISGNEAYKLMFKNQWDPIAASKMTTN